MALTQTENLQLELTDGPTEFDTNKVKGNFEKMDAAYGELNEKMQPTGFGDAIGLLYESVVYKNEYVCESDGILQVRCNWAHGSYVIARINDGIEVTVYTNSTYDDTTYPTNFFPIYKGMKITIGSYQGEHASILVCPYTYG